ncbi:MAG: hypothetical protein HZA54_12505, partial [Planctomycetes bacterium]|nr:hypothetical protein [Planctomycetota bacterium]
AACVGPCAVAAGRAAPLALRSAIAASAGASGAACIVALGAAASTFLALLAGLPALGLVPLAIMAIALVGAARTALTPHRVPLGIKTLLVLALAGVPDLDHHHLGFAVGGRPHPPRGTVWLPDLIAGGGACEILGERWTRHRFLQTARIPAGAAEVGLANGAVSYVTLAAPSWPAVGALAAAVLPELEPGAHVGLAGPWRLRSTQVGPPAATNGSGSSAAQPGVLAFWSPALQALPALPLPGRRTLDDEHSPLQVVLSPDVTTALPAPTTLYVSPEWLRTAEAIDSLAERVSATGLVALIGAGLTDPEGRLARRHLWTLRRPGLRAEGWVRSYGIAPNPDPATPPALPVASAHLVVARLAPADPALPESAVRALAAMGFARIEEERPGGFAPATDDAPFPALDLPGPTGRAAVGAAAPALGLAVLLLAALLARAVRARAFADLPAGAFVLAALPPALTGAAIATLAHAEIYRLMRGFDEPLDAMLLGPPLVAVVLLLGIALQHRRPRFQAICAFLAAGLDATGVVPRENAPALLLLLPALGVTGRVLPALFGRAPSQQCAAWVLGAAGFTAGLWAAAFLPVLAGFRAYDRFAVGLFAAAAIATGVWWRGVRVATALARARAVK